MDNKELTKAFINKLNSLKAISVEQIPNIDLYMDQVTTFMDTFLSDTRRYETDKVLTKTMINNYAKNHLLPAPVNKKYNRNHILYLIYIYYLKNILSISDIQTALSPLAQTANETRDGLTMADIYTFIFSSYKEESYRLMKDITHKLQVSQNAFSEAEPKEQEALQKFTYLCLLGFDIYIKKALMESIIDDMSAEAEETSGKKGRHKKE